MERPHEKIMTTIFVHLFKGFVLFTSSLAIVYFTEFDMNKTLSQECLKYLLGIFTLALISYQLHRDFNKYLD